jgi:hypothetical protein
MEPERPLGYSQQAATGLCTEINLLHNFTYYLRSTLLQRNAKVPTHL